jgi:hypothetical protein
VAQRRKPGCPQLKGAVAMKVDKLTLLTITLLMLLISCATIYDAKQSKGTGQVQVYNSTFAHV